MHEATKYKRSFLPPVDGINLLNKFPLLLPYYIPAGVGTGWVVLAYYYRYLFNLTPPTDYLYDTFQGHTWYIQVLLNRLYGYKDEVNISLVNYAVEEIVAESSYTYQSLLTAYSSSNVKLLKAIAQAECVREINSGEFIARYHLKAASSVNSSLKKLINNELVYKTSTGYVIYDRFMDIWLRQQFLRSIL